MKSRIVHEFLSSRTTESDSGSGPLLDGEKKLVGTLSPVNHNGLHQV